MKSWTIWENGKRRTRWTLYVGRMGRTMPGRTKILRLDQLNVDTNKLRIRSI